MTTATKSFISKNDLKCWDGESSTFTRKTSSGGTASYDVIDWPGVDVYSVYGARTRTAIESALKTVGTSNQVVLFLAPGTWTIDDDLSFASYPNVFVKIPAGTTLNLAAGKTLTAYSPENLVVGPYAYTSGTGTLSFSKAGIQQVLGMIRFIEENNTVLHQLGDTVA